MKLKNFNNFNLNENYNDETGELLLTYNGDPPSTWFYIEDAIIEGLLDEKLQLDEELIEQIGETCFYEENMTQGELSDIIIQDFEGSLQRIFHYLIIDLEHLDDESTVEIKGVDEDGEDWNLYYEPSEDFKQKIDLSKTGKKYNI